MPRDGFDSYEDFQKWRSEIIKNEGSDKGRVENFNEFEEEAKKVVSYRGILSEYAFRRILIDFFYFNEPSEEILNSSKYSELGVSIIKDNRRHGENIDDSVYIKIGAYTPIDSIKKYIEESRELIRSAQTLFAATKKLPKPKKQKSRKNFNRDNLVMFFVELSTKELKEFTPELNARGIYREKRIAEMMKKCGQSIKPEAVKTVTQRRRKMIKALSLK